MSAHRSTSVSKQPVQANVQMFASWPQKRRARPRGIRGYANVLSFRIGCGLTRIYITLNLAVRRRAAGSARTSHTTSKED
jgi:hypothetical protein